MEEKVIPYLVFAGTYEQARNWAAESNIKPGEWRYVYGLDQVMGIYPEDWKVTFVGTWHNSLNSIAAINYLTSRSQRWRDAIRKALGYRGESSPDPAAPGV